MRSVAQMASCLEAAVIALRRRRPSQARGVGSKGDRRICSWGIGGQWYGFLVVELMVVFVLM